MGVILAALLFGFIVQIMGSLNRSAAESFQSSYNYEQKVSTTGPLTDVVLLIPIPSRYDPKTGRNVTPIDLSLASFSNFDRSNVSVRIGGVGGVPMLTRSPGQSEPELPEPPGISSRCRSSCRLMRPKRISSPSSHWSFTGGTTGGSWGGEHIL
ncbi:MULTISPECIES: hypothetical protein [Methanoculleus]|uniref:hypothetical protein n=1 Tax=Methanoculleus TaxID=45989 RepID=UPI00082F0428|nr:MULTISPECIES: hypothetical protein [Methanoculleus]HQD26275.1 hypothetical protein [Methanoculleus thermophilus]